MRKIADYLGQPEKQTGYEIRKGRWPVFRIGKGSRPASPNWMREQALTSNNGNGDQGGEPHLGRRLSFNGLWPWRAITIMSIASSYSQNGGHYKVTGTRRGDPNWVRTIQLLRTALRNAVAAAPARECDNVNVVGTEVLDRIGHLDPAALHVLAITVGVLARASWDQ